MATKRFDDAAEKARALEAQAKKLRREAQAARTKAYADALVAVFPEVKGMGSAEEVLDFVKGLKPGTGHGTPDACSALLDDFRVANDPLRQFADEIFPAASWHLLPCKFLYDLYRHWFQRNQPSGRMLGRNAFYESIEGLAEEQGWQLQERVRSTGRMDFPEPLILEYEVKEWMNKSYRGSDNDRRCMPELNDSYRGYVRISTAFFDGGYDIDDSTNKEE